MTEATVESSRQIQTSKQRAPASPVVARASSRSRRSRSGLPRLLGRVGRGSCPAPPFLGTALVLATFVSATNARAGELPASLEVVRREEPILTRPDAKAPRR